ncbi:MAG TPA: NADH-quinone oxidoreductase subunit NuoB [Verrucomicrobiae bacterium]|nr:NADH-quinone oxidoreductase subunit NuoB [Verrucomicrobiae bacterium]
MFDVLRKSLNTGVVTTGYPATPPEVSTRARGKPEIDFANWKDARPAAAACPTGAIAFADSDGKRTASLDLGKCIFCGLCAEVDSAIRMSNKCELAVRSSRDLQSLARFELNVDGSHKRLIEVTPGNTPARGHSSWRGGASVPASPVLQEFVARREPRPTDRGLPVSSDQPEPGSFEESGQRLRRRIDQMFARSLHIRQVDAGSCNGCEVEIVGLNSPIYDIERFGIHFVASPRHADMLLVTGPVTRNMELALRKTYEAMPAPRLVVAVGACGCSGGIFGSTYATLGGVDRVLPVDVYIPGCPPNPHALLHGILLAVGRAKQRSTSKSPHDSGR